MTKLSSPACPRRRSSASYSAIALLILGCSSEGGDDADKGSSSSATNANDTSDGGNSSNNGNGGDANGNNDDGDAGADVPPIVDVDGQWPGEPNEYSWDGSWTPEAKDFPLDGLLDKIYFDAHEVEGKASPILPPGEWDYEVTSLLANWRGFKDKLGDFSLLKDTQGNHFGWRLERAVPDGVEADAVLQIFHGSSGPDILDLGVSGSFHSAGNPIYGDPVMMGDGPDIFRFTEGYSAAARLGSSKSGALRDNDLALIGRARALPAGTYDVVTSGIHTGPGNDLVFIDNWERAAVDLGNGEDGRTDTIDPNDGRDIVVIGSNARDFRVFGGRGDDLFVWHLDEVNQVPDSWLGPNFFGGGGWGDALFSDPGVDRLLLDIPSDTVLVTQPADSGPGKLLVFIESDYKTVIDTPTEEDPNGRYYVTVPPGPENQRTMVLHYQSTDGSINTAYFYITDIEELQIGIGDDAKLYLLDDVAGTATLSDTLQPVQEIPLRASYEKLVTDWGK